jgi:hypothetical protein
MPLTSEEVTTLADTRYASENGYESREESLFGLLYDVAAEYLAELKRMVADRPESFLGAPDPLGALLAGLRENLEDHDEEAAHEEGHPEPV